MIVKLENGSGSGSYPMAGFRVTGVEANSIAKGFPKPELSLASLIQIQNYVSRRHYNWSRTWSDAISPPVNLPPLEDWLRNVLKTAVLVLGWEKARIARGPSFVLNLHAVQCMLLRTRQVPTWHLGPKATHLTVVVRGFHQPLQANSETRALHRPWSPLKFHISNLPTVHRYIT